MDTHEPVGQTMPQRPRTTGDTTQAAYLILDTETVPDGRLLQQIKYPDEPLSPEDAVARAQAEARQLSPTGSDFLPVTFQVPVAVVVLNVAADFTLQRIACLDAPLFRSAEITRKFWRGVAHHKRAKLVTFNGRGFDLPLLELAAFRHAIAAGEWFRNSRKRFDGNHIDLYDWMSNFGACRLNGGLNLLAKLLGKPGKMGVAGDQVYGLWREGRLKEINDYCLHDTLDTYFVFLRTRVLTGALASDEESVLAEKAQAFLADRVEEWPALRQYLDHWGSDEPVMATAAPV